MAVSELGMPTDGVRGKIEDGKRFKLPGVYVQSRCPNCDKVCKHDLGGERRYLSYPKMNEPFDYPFYCEGCDAEWKVKLQLDVSLRFA